MSTLYLPEIPVRSRHEIRRLFGATALKSVFSKLRKEVREWRIESLLPGEEKFLNVHFDLKAVGSNAGTRISPSGR